MYHAPRFAHQISPCTPTDSEVKQAPHWLDTYMYMYMYRHMCTHMYMHYMYMCVHISS